MTAPELGRALAALDDATRQLAAADAALARVARDDESARNLARAAIVAARNAVLAVRDLL